MVKNLILAQWKLQKCLQNSRAYIAFAMRNVLLCRYQDTIADYTTDAVWYQYTKVDKTFLRHFNQLVSDNQALSIYSAQILVTIPPRISKRIRHSSKLCDILD